MPDCSPDSLSAAEKLFADWLARREGEGGAQDLESLCRDHPKEAAELRRLWVYWDGLRSVLKKAGFSSGPRSLAEKIQDKFGSGVDPNVSLDAGEGAVPPSGALLKRLAVHTLKTSRYKFHGEIARGGMGAILKVFDEDLRRNLAMKVILGRAEEVASGGTPPVDKRLLARFLEEAQITGQLDHPGIVPVHELGLDSEGHVYFTMKLVKGRDLKQIFDLAFEEQEGWNETRALGVLLKVCEAMAYAHKKGVIHRDLKPANVMVGNFGEVYVMDWGLARVEGREDHHDIRLQLEGTPLTSLKTERREEREEAPDSPLFTMDGDVVGTPAYMAPEQARGEIERLSARSDVYAVGAMLYHLLARQMPYVPSGARVSNRMVLLAVTQGPPAALASLRKDVPSELVAIAKKAMAREPEQRYVDTLELAQDLRAFTEGGVVRAFQSSVLRRLRTYWKRQAAPTRLGVILGYVAIPALLLVAFLVLSDAENPKSASFFFLGGGLLVFSSAALLIGGLFIPRKPRLLGAIALVPLLFSLAGTFVSSMPRSSPDAERRKAVADAIGAGRFEDAIATIRAVPLAERGAADQIDLARSLRKMGWLEEAVTALDEASGLPGRRYADLDLWRALLLLDTDRASDARTALESYLGRLRP